MKYPEQNMQHARGAWYGDDVDPVVSPRRILRSSHKRSRSPEYTPVPTYRGSLAWNMERDIRRQNRREDRQGYALGMLEARDAGIRVRIGSVN
jgi:hypothetical protein